MCVEEKGLRRRGGSTLGKLARIPRVKDTSSNMSTPPLNVLFAFAGPEGQRKEVSTLVRFIVDVKPLTNERPCVADKLRKKSPTGKNQSTTKLKGISSQAKLSGSLRPVLRSEAIVLELREKSSCVLDKLEIL
jgi:hypothetical protein